MRLATTALLMGTSLLSVNAFADDFTSEAPITNVVVYRDGGATVTRTGSIQLPAGRHTITVDKLTEALEDDSITAAFSTADVQIYALETGTSYSASPASERQLSLQAELDQLETSDKQLMVREQAKQMQLNFLQGLQKRPTDDDGLAFEDWGKALAFVGDQSLSVLTDIEATRKERRALNDRRATLLRELAATGPSRQDYSTASMTVEASRAQRVDYSISYFVNDARWSLKVNGALDTAEGSLSLQSIAIVSQETGEDWNGVSLALSNQVPTRYLGGIFQRPIFLSLQDPNQARPRMTVDAMAPSPLADMKLEEADEVIVTGAHRVQVSSSQFDRLYQVNGKSSIPSSSEEEFIELARNVSRADLVIRANPARDNNAYLFADTELMDFHSLRNVEPTLVRDGHYVGKGRWPDLEADKPLELPYGADPAIEVRYTEQAPEDGDSGFFGRDNAEEKRYLISVTNNHSTAATVEIFDQVPVAGHEDIKVKALSGATKATETDMDGKQGLMMWRKTLGASETWTIQHRYRITYPSDKTLIRRQ